MQSRVPRAKPALPTQRGNEMRPETAVQALDAVLAKLATPETWTQNAWARNGAGEPCKPMDNAAVSWCWLGALHAVFGVNPDAFASFWPAFHQAIAAMEHGLVTPVGRWNDLAAVGYQNVTQATHKARALAETGG